MPFNLENANFQRIPLSIPREEVNVFLGALWDEFTRTIGRVSSFQNYLDTDDPEVFEYCVCWSDRDLPFIAELSFYNHTAKGLTHVLLAALDFEERVPDREFEERIRAAITKVASSPLRKKKEYVAYVMVPFRTGVKLSGDYKLPFSGIMLTTDRHSDGVDGRIVFPLHAGNEEERIFEGSNRALEIASALTVVTQRLFYVDDKVRWLVLSPGQFQDLWDDTNTSGIWVDDSGFNNPAEEKTSIRIGKTKEIIEEDACVVGDGMGIPEQTDRLLRLILNDERCVQSCRRFHEALDLRRTMSRELNKVYTISYELIAYVASIEALLEREKEKISVLCPKCGTVMSREEWKISDRFKKFIDRHSRGNPILKKVFKQVYEDRSKFVHTGVNLHNFLAYRQKRPLILDGKRHIGDFPNYYFNIHEYTGYLLRKCLYARLDESSASPLLEGAGDYT